MNRNRIPASTSGYESYCGTILLGGPPPLAASRPCTARRSQPGLSWYRGRGPVVNIGMRAGGGTPRNNEWVTIAPREWEWVVVDISAYLSV